MNSTPSVHFQIASSKFSDLLKVLRIEMNQHLTTLDQNDRHEVLLFEMNYWLILSWISLEDKTWQKANLKVKVDLMFAKAFMEYWQPIALPTYEDVLLRKVLVDLDERIHAMATKRRFINL